jgi:hypothetical protein
VARRVAQHSQPQRAKGKILASRGDQMGYENEKGGTMTHIPTGNDKYEIRVTKLSVMPPSDPIFSEQATHVEIQDEAGGEYLSIQQHHMEERTQILIDRKEWPILRDAINFMIGECRDN